MILFRVFGECEQEGAPALTDTFDVWFPRWMEARDFQTSKRWKAGGDIHEVHIPKTRAALAEMLNTLAGCS